MRIILILVFAFLQVDSAFPSASGPKATVVIAVREHAPPFVRAREDPDGDFKFKNKNWKIDGYLWDICYYAVTNYLDSEVKIVVVDAGTRGKILEPSRYTDPDGQRAVDTFDLFCDPTTVTLSRMEAFYPPTSNADLSFSPIVYLANGAFVQPKNLDGYKLAKGRISVENFQDLTINGKTISDPESKNKNQKVQAAGINSSGIVSIDDLRSDPKTLCEMLDVDKNKPSEKQKNTSSSSFFSPRLFPTLNNSSAGKRFATWGYVKGASIRSEVEQALNRVSDDWLICLFEFESHEAAATSFCRGRLFRYFGDIEIVRTAISSFKRTNSESCDIDEQSIPGGSYEPYAFVLNSRTDGFAIRFNRAIYAMFTDNIMVDLFSKHFPRSEPSRYLGILFQINSIPRGD